MVVAWPKRLGLIRSKRFDNLGCMLQKVIFSNPDAYELNMMLLPYHFCLGLDYVGLFEGPSQRSGSQAGWPVQALLGGEKHVGKRRCGVLLRLA